MASDLESAVTELWQDILGADRIDASVPFGQLGGDSLIAVRVLSRCHRLFGADLPLRALGPGTSLTEFLAELRASQPSQPTSAARPRRDPAGSFQPSGQTRSLAGLHLLDPHLPVYHVAVRLSITGSLDRGRLRSAVNVLVSRHDALRTTFRGRAGEITATVAPALAPDYAETDLTNLLASARDAEVARLVRRWPRLPLDLARSPARFRLIRETADRHVLVVVVHHAVCDGLSMRILLRDLTTLYRDGTDRALPALAMGIADLADLETARLAKSRRAELAERWRVRLAGAPALIQLPGGLSRPARPSFRGARVRLDVPADLLARLRRLAAGQAVSVFSVMASALGVLLSRYCAQPEVVIGAPVAGREVAQAQDVVANFSRMVPLRLRPDHQASVGTLLAAAEAVVLAAREDSDLPFDAIVAAAGSLRSTSFNPVFQVALALLAGTDEYAAIPGLLVAREDLGTGTAKFDLTWYFQETADAMEGYLEYATDLFPVSFAERLAGHYLALLGGLSRGAQQIVGTLDLPGARVRGHRIEVADIEAALLESPEVSASLVRIEPDPGGEAQLVGYVAAVGQDDLPGLVPALRSRLRDRLPEYLVPDRLYVVPWFPLTGNGEVDVPALRLLSQADRDLLRLLLSEAEAAS